MAQMQIVTQSGQSLATKDGSSIVTQGSQPPTTITGFGSLAQWRGKLGNGVLNRFRWRS